MNSPEFVYTTYIRTTPEKLWDAITNPEFTRQYWGGYGNISDWKKGSKWKHVGDDEKHTVRVVGEVLESVPPKLLVLTWADPADPACLRGDADADRGDEQRGEHASGQMQTLTHTNPPEKHRRSQINR